MSKEGFIVNLEDPSTISNNLLPGFNKFKLAIKDLKKREDTLFFKIKIDKKKDYFRPKEDRDLIKHDSISSSGS